MNLKQAGMQHVYDPDELGKRHHTVLWSVLGVLLLLALAGAVGVYKLYNEAMQVKDDETKAMTLLKGVSSGSGVDAFTEVADSLPQVRKYAKDANSISHGALWNIAAKVPVVGGDIKNVQGMTQALDSMTTDSIPQFVTIFTNLKGASLSSGDGNLNLDPLIKTQQQMVSANKSFQGAVKQFDALPTPKISMIKNTYDSAKTKVDGLAGQVNQMSGMMNLLPQFLGTDSPKTYLVAAMTTSEARISGGLIGSVGTMTTSNGKIEMGKFHSNAELIPYGKGEPTADETKAMTDWGPLNMSFDIRDLAAFPETKSSADNITTIWKRTPWGAKQQIDAVILVDPVFLQELNGINGGVTLKDGRTLDGKNTAEFLLNTVYKDYSPLQQDLYFQQVVDQGMSQMFSGMDMNKLMGIAKIMGTMTKGRHFNVYSYDESMEQTLDAAGYTAHAPNSEEKPTVGVYINEQNPSKMDWYVHRTSTISGGERDSNGGKKYHVEYKIFNSLTTETADDLPNYIAGSWKSDARGAGFEKVFIYAPRGGKISNMKTTGNLSESRTVMMNGVSVQASLALVRPQKTVTYSFDVEVSPNAREDLEIDQTPQGWIANNDSHL